MSESKHTKGDRWVESIQDSKYPDLYTYSVLTIHKGQVCSIAEIDNDIEEANLIAAAPETKAQRDELLEALKYTIQRIKDIDEWWIDDPDSGFDVDIIQSAIAKAENHKPEGK